MGCFLRAPSSVTFQFSPLLVFLFPQLLTKYLAGKVGSKGYVSALLNKRKPLTLELAKLFHRELSIPADVLLA